MHVLFAVALPFFALIFCGYGAGHFRLLSEPAIVGLNSFVFYFALPALLFFKMADAPLSALLQWKLFVSYSGGGLLSFATIFLLGRLAFRGPLKENALRGMAGAFPNVGYLGLPLVIAVYGDRATVPAVLVMVLDHLILLPLTTFLIEADSDQHRTPAAVFLTALRGLSRNPLIVATVAGGVLSVTGIGPLLPLPVKAFGNLLGGAAGPCALFALGASLAGKPITDRFSEVALMTGTKLFVHPTFAALIAFKLLHLNPYLAGIAITEASLPIAANVFVMARAYGTYVARTSTAILVSTILSVVTVSALLTLLAPHP